jgi:hypothetical protein
MRKKQIVAILEQQIIEEHDELHWDEHQHSRAYHSGLMDGIAFALKLLKPNSTVLSLASVWFDDDMDMERKREQLIEFDFIDMGDPEPVIFETPEVDEEYEVMERYDYDVR